MHIPFDILIAIKYIAAAMILGIIYIFPVWVAAQTKKGKDAMGLIRMSSWLFGWTGVGWVLALYWATKK